MASAPSFLNLDVESLTKHAALVRSSALDQLRRCVVTCYRVLFYPTHPSIVDERIRDLQESSELKAAYADVPVQAFRGACIAGASVMVAALCGSHLLTHDCKSALGSPDAVMKSYMTDLLRTMDRQGDKTVAFFAAHRGLMYALAPVFDEFVTGRRLVSGQGYKATIRTMLTELEFLDLHVVSQFKHFLLDTCRGYDLDIYNVMLFVGMLSSKYDPAILCLISPCYTVDFWCNRSVFSRGVPALLDMNVLSGLAGISDIRASSIQFVNWCLVLRLRTVGLLHALHPVETIGFKEFVDLKCLFDTLDSVPREHVPESDEFLPFFVESGGHDARMHMNLILPPHIVRACTLRYKRELSDAEAATMTVPFKMLPTMRRVMPPRVASNVPEARGTKRGADVDELTQAFSLMDGAGCVDELTQAFSRMTGTGEFKKRSVCAGGGRPAVASENGGGAACGRKQRVLLKK